MITIRMLTGPYAGQVRTSRDVERLGIEPGTLLTDLGSRDLWWEIDYSQATAAETLEWARYDLVARVIRALMHDRTVTVFGFDFRGWDPETVGMVEDTIANSGKDVTVGRDDENGLEIIGIDNRPADKRRPS